MRLLEIQKYLAIEATCLQRRAITTARNSAFLVIDARIDLLIDSLGDLRSNSQRSDSRHSKFYQQKAKAPKKHNKYKTDMKP